MSDLISREAAIAYHAEKLSSAKSEANHFKSEGDDDSAADCLHEAILHSEAVNFIRALPAAPAVKEAAAVMKAARDADFASRDLVLAACFAAQAYEAAVVSGVTADGAPAALLRAFLTALTDPLSEDLDYLRADPASGAAARAKLEGGDA